MGTSSSSSGPGSGVPFDPPWLSDVANELGAPLEQISGLPQGEQNQPQVTLQPSEFSPPRRFGSARRNLGEYIRSGSSKSLKKALASYSKKGMGGAANLASRMRISASVGAGLFDFLQGVRDSTDSSVRDWVDKLTEKNLSAYELADEIINQVVRTGGSLDEESCKNSMALAMSDLLLRDPNINLLDMGNDNIWHIIELFMANEAFNRISLDIGQIFESKKYSAREIVARSNEIKSYLKSEISAQMEILKEGLSSPTNDKMSVMLHSAIRNTFEVFEEEE